MNINEQLAARSNSVSIRKSGGKIVNSRLKLETGSRVALGDRGRINKVMVQFCAAVKCSNKSNKRL